MIKYIGSKRVLVDTIVDIVEAVPGVETVCDLFTGTTRVAQGFKRAEFDVIANDTATYSEVLGLTYIAADRRKRSANALREKLQHLEELPGVEGYFTQTFCRDARYFQPKNGNRVDAIRAEIDEIAEDRIEWAILLTSLMEAADRVDSTAGVQMAYIKKWSKRSYNDLQLRLPKLLPGSGTVHRKDAQDFVEKTQSSVDLYYLDPPYNQHSYYSNYHIWETLVRNDSPEVYGVAKKRIDCRTTKSPFNSKKKAWAAFSSLIQAIHAPYALVSFSNEGFFPADDIVRLLGGRFGEVAVLPVEHKRYVGAQIGIYNPDGEKVGKVSHLDNREYLFLAGAEASGVIEQVRKSRAIKEDPQMSLLSQ